MFQEAVRKYKAEVVRQFESSRLKIAEKLRYSHRQALNIIREFPQSVIKGVDNGQRTRYIRQGAKAVLTMDGFKVQFKEHRIDRISEAFQILLETKPCNIEHFRRKSLFLGSDVITYAWGAVLAEGIFQILHSTNIPAILVLEVRINRLQGVFDLQKYFMGIRKPG